MKETTTIIQQFKDAFDGDPWFGRNAKALFAEINEANAFEKPNGQHSLLELVWHMVNWREFAITRVQPDAGKDLHYFETNDWRQLDHSDTSLLQKGLDRLAQTQEELLDILESFDDNKLNESVPERQYSFRKLFTGILQHDIYHLGQIAYLLKVLINYKF